MPPEALSKKPDGEILITKHITTSDASFIAVQQARCQTDLLRVLDCHIAVFGEQDRPIISAHLLQRPGMRPEQVYFVQNERGQVVSSLSFCPQTWTYEGIPIPVSEVSVVSTRKGYRGYGYVRRQFAAYHREAVRRGCLLSAIAGIGSFYRQFGYEYALPMGGRHTRLHLDQIPTSLPKDAKYVFRPRTERDLPAILEMYRQLAQQQCIASVQSKEIWAYQENLPSDCPDYLVTFVAEYEGRPVGFIRLHPNSRDPSRPTVRITGAYLPLRSMCMAALQLAKNLALRQGPKGKVIIEIPVETPLGQLAVELGAQIEAPYAWWVRLLDPIRFLLRIAPALERRLAVSSFADYSGTLLIGLHKRTLCVQFHKGHLQEVRTLPFRWKEADIVLPPEVLSMLLLCYRNIDEIVDWYADASIKDQRAQHLVQILFPKKSSWIWSLY